MNTGESPIVIIIVESGGKMSRMMGMVYRMTGAT